MRLRGEYRIGAPADAVWLALNDPQVLSQCIEGCQSVTRVGDEAFAATVKAKIGDVSGVFTAEVKLADLDPPNACAVEASIKGGAAGSARGSARISLSQEGRETLLRYEIDGRPEGKLAQVGQRLIDAAARKAADDFFARFGEIVAPAGATARAATPAPRPNLLAPTVIAMAAVAGLFALFRWRRPAVGAQTENTA